MFLIMDMCKNMDKIPLLQTILEGLGSYEFTPLIAQFIQFMLNNQDESLVLVDPQGHIAFMDRYSEKFFNLSPGGAQNMHINDLISDAPLLKVLKTGHPQIWQLNEVRGKKKIVSRLPIFKNDKLIGATARVITHEFEEIEKLSLKIKQLKEKVSSYERHLLATNRAHYTFDDILGISASIVKTKERAKHLATTNATILITGESGTGKELFAHSIHQYSSRSKGPFVRVNCAAIPFSLAESELFGYVKGAFTGSNTKGQKGKFEIASGGTIFLDEISSMPLAIQAMILRVLQEREIQPIGSVETKKIDFRLIAATNVDLEAQTRKGSLRGDLYYRLSAVPCFLTPLRERPEDIPFLAKSLLEGINRKLNGNVKFISPDALEILMKYEWPGNVRELINIIEQGILNAYPAEKITVEDLPDFLRNQYAYRPKLQLRGISHAIGKAEKKAISDALMAMNGNKKSTANLLGISRSALYQKMHKHNMI